MIRICERVPPARITLADEYPRGRQTAVIYFGTRHFRRLKRERERKREGGETDDSRVARKREVAG